MHTYSNQVCRLKTSLMVYVKQVDNGSTSWHPLLSLLDIIIQNMITYYSSNHLHNILLHCSSTLTIMFLLIIFHNKLLLINTFTFIFPHQILRKIQIFSGLEVSRTYKRVHICRHKYALDILAYTRLLAEKLVATPMIKYSKPLYVTSAPRNDHISFLHLIVH